MPSLAEQLRPLLLSEAEAAGLDVRGRIDAAVLVALYELDGELHAVFTRRRDDMRRHAGEISFPGGRQDVDEEDLRDTAHLAGALAPTPTVVTNYAIYPFVGTIEPGRRWRPSAAEVAEVLELSLPRLLAGHSRKRLLRRGVPFRTDVYEIGGHLIWGATGRILSELFERLEPLIRDGA